MKLCRFHDRANRTRVGLLPNELAIVDITSPEIPDLNSLLEREDLSSILASLAHQQTWIPRDSVTLLSPIDRQEVWAAGVTYLRSKTARMEESDFSANVYDRVYTAARPELFFKSLPEKVAASGSSVGIRKDARWNVPEPELALVINSRGRVVGYTIGNDMSSRDIEGENLLYLPQAKVYHRSCAVGPVICVGPGEAEARTWSIGLQITRQDATVFEAQTSVSQIKRSFEELAEYLFRSQVFPNGAVLLTGTGIVPPDNFSLAEGDVVRIEISGIGTLINPVVLV